MRVAVCPGDAGPVGSYRLLFPARAARAAGADIVVVPPDNPSVTYDTDGYGRPTRILTAPDADVIVFQRPAGPELPAIIPLLRRAGYAVVVDMDDDLSAIPPSNPAFAFLHPNGDGKPSWENARAACRAATLVTVSTTSLAATYGAHGRVRVLHNRIPAAYLAVRHDPPFGDGHIVWPGSLHGHEDDLAPAAAAIQRLVREGHPFRVVGDATGVGRALGLDADPTGPGQVEFGDWAYQIARWGNVGIAPLADNRFNRGKSWLKCLEMSAVGVAWVASDTPEYVGLWQQGAGEVVARRGWYPALKRLVTDDALRAERADAGRAVAADNTYEGYAHQWAEAWEWAMHEQARTMAYTA